MVLEIRTGNSYSNSCAPSPEPATPPPPHLPAAACALLDPRDLRGHTRLCWGDTGHTLLQCSLWRRVSVHPWLEPGANAGPGIREATAGLLGHSAGNRMCPGPLRCWLWRESPGTALGMAQGGDGWAFSPCPSPPRGGQATCWEGMEETQREGAGSLVSPERRALHPACTALHRDLKEQPEAPGAPRALGSMDSAPNEERGCHQKLLPHLGDTSPLSQCHQSEAKKVSDCMDLSHKWGPGVRTDDLVRGAHTVYPLYPVLPTPSSTYRP